MADGATAGHKRRRVEGDGDVDDLQAASFTKHGRLWFEDGNVILICDQTGFRVHRSLLSLHSSVFRDMFDVATPGDDLSEGIPVVHLSDDPFKIAKFLGFFYFRDEIPTHIGPVLDFFEISSKYDVPLIRDLCVANLRRAFPDTLSSFQDARTYRNDELDMDLTSSLRCVNLANAQGLHLLLPAMTLTCVAKYTFDTATEDIELYSILQSLGLPLSLQPKLASWSRKLLSEKRTKVDGHIQQFLQDPDRERNYHCAQQLAIAFLSYTNQTFLCADEWRHEYDLDIFVKDMYAADLTRMADDVCDDCIQEWKEKEKAGRKELWDALPGYFDLGTWEELRMKDSDVPGNSTEEVFSNADASG
ncbi:unnamed protein product [Peniophora sp. CBMAI 1063]|nr:unnamed protein product [Peniophora sp. CBMAI 1063]